MKPGKKSAKGYSCLTTLCSLFFLAFITAPCPARAQEADQDCGKLFARINSKDKVAVLDIFEQEYNDITRLGEELQSRVEGRLAAQGLTVTPRQEIGIISDDMAMFDGPALDWNSLKADVAVLGRYYLPRVKNLPGVNKDAEEVRVSLKVVKDGNHILGCCEYRLPMQPGWEALAAQTVNREQPGSKENRPPVTAFLDRKTPCYPNRAAMEITVSAPVGTWLYLFSIGWDGTVTRLYPNGERASEHSLIADTFVFPADSGRRTKLRVMGKRTEQKAYQSRESIAVVAGRHRMDFSGIPVPWDRPLRGEAAFSQPDFSRLLREQSEYTLKYLRYTVGPECGPGSGNGFL